MFLDQAADLCRECHRLAPFCNFSGNTFAAIARSLLGHVVAGTSSEVEDKELREFSRSRTVERLRKR